MAAPVARCLYPSPRCKHSDHTPCHARRSWQALRRCCSSACSRARRRCRSWTSRGCSGTLQWTGGAPDVHAGTCASPKLPLSLPPPPPPPTAPLPSLALRTRRQPCHTAAHRKRTLKLIKEAPYAGLFRVGAGLGVAVEGRCPGDTSGRGGDIRVCCCHPSSQLSSPPPCTGPAQQHQVRSERCVWAWRGAVRLQGQSRRSAAGRAAVPAPLEPTCSATRLPISPTVLCLGPIVAGIVRVRGEYYTVFDNSMVGDTE